MTDTIDVTVLKILNRHRPQAAEPQLLASCHAYREAHRLGLISAAKEPPARVCLGDFERRVWTPRPPLGSDSTGSGWYFFDRSA
jgi:hypothetical protein